MADVAPATEADAASKPPVETTEEVAPVDNAAAELSNMSLAEPPADTRIIRLFIPDIAPTTTVPKLSAHFSQFGEVHHAVIKHPAAGSTERTRSFGFISVVGEAAANVILQTTHIIDGRVGHARDCQAASPGAVLRPIRPPQHGLPRQYAQFGDHGMGAEYHGRLGGAA